MLEFRTLFLIALIFRAGLFEEKAQRHCEDACLAALYSGHCFMKSTVDVALLVIRKCSYYAGTGSAEAGLITEPSESMLGY